MLEFLSLGGVFLEVKNYSKNFGTKKRKANIYADTHVNIKYFDFSNYFCHFETVKVMKIQEN